MLESQCLAVLNATSLKSQTQATQRVGELRSALRELESLKGVANDVNRMMSETQDLKHDVENLERQLESSGSARTADDVQAELQQLGSTM